MVLEIPADITRSIRLPEDRVEEELRREFAVFLVKQGLLPQHKACKLARMERLEFEDLLARRGMDGGGSAADVLADAETAASWDREGE